MNLFGSLDDELDSTGDGGFGSFNNSGSQGAQNTFGMNNDFADESDGFGFDDNGFDSNDNGFNSFGNQSGQDNNFDSSFDDSFDDNSNIDDDNQSNYESNNGRNTTKTAIIAIVVGIVILIIVVFIGKKVASGKSDGTSESNSNSIAIPGQTQQVTNSSADRGAKNVDGLMTDGKNDGQNQQHSNSNSNNNLSNNTGGNWQLFDGNASISFDGQKKDLTFTVTGIRHYVATVDSLGTLAVKTTLTGSLSGMAGTYYLDVPYSKGTKLVVGDEFTVHVQIGTYNGKNVVGEISF